MKRPDPLLEVEGTVVPGKRLGRRLGIPTANLPYDPEDRVLMDGVYVAEMVLLEQGDRVVPGVLNQGRHPTVPEGPPTIEVHLFDFDEDLYGQKVRVRYLAYMRPELAFPDKESLRLKMLDDVRVAKRWHQEHPG